MVRDPFSRWFFDDRFAPQPVIHRITPTPLLIVHGTRDPIVPYHHGLQLLKRPPSPRSFGASRKETHPDAGRYRRRYLAPFVGLSRKGPKPVWRTISCFCQGIESGPDPVFSSQLNNPPGSIKTCKPMAFLLT